VTLSPLALRWHLPLVAGLLPLLAVGFLWSALADRTAFAGWALVSGGAYVLLLRRSLEAGWPALRRTAALALLLAACCGWLGALVAAHHEILDLGFRAVLPALYHPLLTAPATVLTLAAVLALAGAVAWAAEAARRRSAA